MYLRCCRVRYLFRSKTAVRKIAHISSTDVCVTLRDNVKAAITQSFSAEMGRTAKLDIMPTQNAKFGDYQCSAAFSLASSLRKPPREVASAIVASIQCGDVIESASVAGGGFINMKLTSSYIASSLLRQVKDPNRLGIAPTASPATIIVDYSSPNIAKEMHVGHLRSTIIGDSISNILEYLGYTVIRLNHIGDWGTQFGMLLHYLFTHNTDIGSMSIGDLMQAYQAARRRYDADEEFAIYSRHMVVRLQRHESAIMQAWSQICTISRTACNSIYSTLNISKLQERGESFYAPMCADIVSDLLRHGIAQESDGAVVILPPVKSSLIPLIVRKSDGSFLYATSDIAAVKHRFHTEHASEVLYVTDNGQAKHFESVFAAAERAGYVGGTVRHVPFGVVLGEDGKKLKTRSGETIRLADLLDESIERAKHLLQTRNSCHLLNSEQAEIARAIGIGAVKYADLSMNREGAYRFSYDKMLAFTGNTAPYLLYAYVRIQSISSKISDKINIAEVSALSLEKEEEIALAKQLLRLESVLIDIASHFYTHKLCDYLYDLSQVFNVFYEKCSVLAAETPEALRTRLVLCHCTARHLKTGLELLGLETVDKM